MYFSLVKYVVTFSLALVASLLLVPLAKRLAPLLGLIDEPSERRIHQTPIPRSGGIAVFFATHLALLVVAFGPWRNLGGAFNPSEWGSILLGSSILLLIGLIDDRLDVSAWMKLAGQLAVAGLMFSCGFSFEALLGLQIPWVINFCATLFWYALLINAFNLIDGMDGACAGLGSISGLAMVAVLVFLHQPSAALVILALVGACIGFLRYNFHPASIFLGDCGSMFIGFMLASVGLKAHVAQSMLVAVLIPLLTVGVPVFDVMVAVWRRTARKMVSVIRKEDGGNKVFGPDLDHIHHKLMRMGLSQGKAALWLYSGALFVCLLAVCVAIMDSHRSALLLVALVVILHVVVRQLVHIELWDSAQVLLNGLVRPRAVVRVMLHILCDLLTLFGATFIVYTVSGTPFGLLKGVVSVAIPLLVLSFFGIYRTIWARSRPTQLFKLGLEVLSCEVLVYVILLIMDQRDSMLIWRQAAHWMIASMGVMGVRVAPRILRDFSSGLRRFQGHRTATRTLLVGAGYETVLYMRWAACQNHAEVSRIVIGIVDENRNLAGMKIYGYPVLGCFNYLEELIRTKGISELLVCARLTDEQREWLFQLQAQYQFALREFRSGLYEMNGRERSSDYVALGESEDRALHHE